MKLTILGTGNAMATECYNTCFVIENDGRHFMVDGGGGNGILHQLKAAGLNWMDMRDIFVTHKHLDHLMGIFWMVRLICQTMDRGGYDGDARIYAHDDVISIIRDFSCRLLKPKETRFIDDRLHLIEVHDGETKEIAGRQVTFFDIHSTKEKQFGFSMELSDGEKLTCCGDEPYSEYEHAYAENSKWLLHEAFCLYAQADRFAPYEKHHSTVKDACELAEALHVRNIVLYHTEDENLSRRKELYSEEGRRYFCGKIFVPDDLETIEL